MYAGLGLNIGILHKNYEFITGKKYSENDFPVYSIAPYAGYCFPLSDKINFDINTKLIYWLGDNELGSLMFGAGIEYSL